MDSIYELKIVITVNKNDLWFCRICVASIRHFYPDMPIYLIKDTLNGDFSTIEIEKYWNVKLIEFPVKKFGWSAAKIFLYTDPRFTGEYLFVIDSDIVFAGKVLDSLLAVMSDYDVIVSIEEESNPYQNWVKEVYFDVKEVEEFNLDYKYPGYFFNAGQIFVKGGFITADEVIDYFDFQKFPYWKNLQLFPLVDQSLLNYLLPVLTKQRGLKVNSSNKYMFWSVNDISKKIPLNDIIDGEKVPALIHWAGDIRIPYLSKMNCNASLIYFEQYYYSKIPYGFLLRNSRKIFPIIKYYIRKVFFLVKTIMHQLGIKRVIKFINR